MKMPNAHSAPRGRRPSLRMEDGGGLPGIPAALGVVQSLESQPGNNWQPKDTTVHFKDGGGIFDDGIFGDGNFLGEGGTLDNFRKSIQAQPVPLAVRQQSAFPGRGIPAQPATLRPIAQNPQPVSYGNENRVGAAPTGVPNGTGNSLRMAGPAAPMPAAPMPAAPVLNPTAFAQHQGITAAPAAPVVAPGQKPNAFGDAAAAANSPTAVKRADGSMYEWSAAGKSNGRPDEGAMAAAQGLMTGGYSNAGRAMALHKSLSPNFAGLRNGGEIHAADGIGSTMWKLVTGQKAMPAPPPAPVTPPPAPVAPPPAPAPTTAIGGYAAGTALDARMKAAGLRNGGGLRMPVGVGGEVPGQGQGDKIPAKYEPGEFVVSNDMLDAQPQLREHLNALRTDVLAQKGMTPQEADAKALNGGKEIHADVGLGVDGRAGTMIQPEYPVTVIPEATPVGNGRAVPPVAGDPYIAGKYIGGRVAGAARAVINNPIVSGGMRVAGGVNALREGAQTGADIDSGNYAGAIDHGAKTVASLAGYGPGALGGMQAGAAGAAYLVGHAAGSVMDSRADQGKSTLGYDAAAKESLGRNINAGVRAVGGAFGQDWGVDDTALRQQEGVPLTRGVNAGAPAPVAPQQDFTAANAAVLAAANAESPDGKAPVQDQIRNVNNTDGTQDVFNKGAWQTVSTPQAKAARALRDEQYGAKLASDAAVSRADTARQLAYFEGQKSKADMYAGLGPNHAAVLRAQMASVDAQREGHRLSSDTSLRTTQMNNETSVYGHNMANKLGVANAMREQANKNREFEASREDAKTTQTMAGNKDWAEHALSSFQKPNPKTGVMENDPGQAAGYTAFANQLMLDPKFAAKYPRGLGQLDAADRAGLVNLYRTKQLQDATHSRFAPWGSQGTTSNRPQDYIPTGQGNGSVYNANGSIPANALRYGADYNVLLPNIGAADTTLLPPKR